MTNEDRKSVLARELICAWLSELELLEITVVQSANVIAGLADVAARKLGADVPEYVAIDCFTGEFNRLMRKFRNEAVIRSQTEEYPRLKRKGG